MQQILGFLVLAALLGVFGCGASQRTDSDDTDPAAEQKQASTPDNPEESDKTPKSEQQPAKPTGEPELTGGVTESAAPPQRPEEKPPKTAVLLHQQAQEALERGQQERALELFGQALDEWPRYADAWHDRGLIYKKLWKKSSKDLENALFDLTRALELAPQNAAWWADRADLYRRVAKATDQDQARNQAVADYTQALKLDGDSSSSATWYFWRAATQADLDNLAEADQDYRKVIALINAQEPDAEQLSAGRRQLLAYAWINNCGLLADAGITAQAMTFGDGAVRVAPNNAMAQYNRGRAYLDGSQFGEALESLNRAVALNRKFARAYFQRAQVFALLEDYEAAVEDLQAVFRSEGPSAESLGLLGRMFLRSGRYEEAAELLTKVTDTQPKGLFWMDLGDTYLQLGDGQAALDAYHQATRADPSLIEPSICRADVYRYAGREKTAQALYKKALGICNQRIGQKPTDSQAYLLQGHLLAAEGQWAAARQAYQKAASLEPQSFQTLSHAAWALATTPQRDLRDGQQALKLAERACQQSLQRVPWCLNVLAAAYAELGDFDRAQLWQRRALAVVPNAKKGAYYQRLALYAAGEPYRQTPRQTWWFVQRRVPGVDADDLPESGLACWKGGPAGLVRPAEASVEEDSAAIVSLKSKSGTGSGMIIDSAGYVLTAADVLPRVGEITVIYRTAEQAEQSSPLQAEAWPVAVDYRFDLALLRFQPQGLLKSVTFPRNGEVKAGEEVILGQPSQARAADQLVAGWDVRQATVVNPARLVGKRARQRQMLISQAVGPSFFGGPVFNNAGQVVGVIATSTPEVPDSSLAVPLPTVIGFLDPQRGQ